MFNKLFDFNKDGRLDAFEQTIEYMTYLKVTGQDKEDEEKEDEDD